MTDSGLPSFIKSAYEAQSTANSSGFLGKLAKKIKGGDEGDDGSLFKGVYPSSASSSSAEVALPTRLSILNASLLSSSDDHHMQSVIVLPDFKIVHSLGESKEAAAELVERYLRPAVGRAGAPTSLPESPLRSWPLPYSAVVLLCELARIHLQAVLFAQADDPCTPLPGSHKRRDKRCHIAAPLLLNQFHHHLEHHGLEVDERGDDLSDGASIEEWEGDREVKLEESLKGVKSNGGRVGIFKVSHIGERLPSGFGDPAPRLRSSSTSSQVVIATPGTSSSTCPTALQSGTVASRPATLAPL